MEWPFTDVELRVPNIDKARKILGFEPRVDLDEGLLRTIEWYRARHAEHDLEPLMVKSHGTGEFSPSQFARLGAGVVFEAGVLVFHPENIEIGDDVYVGHQTILKGYHNNKMTIGDGDLDRPAVLPPQRRRD